MSSSEHSESADCLLSIRHTSSSVLYRSVGLTGSVAIWSSIWFTQTAGFAPNGNDNTHVRFIGADPDVGNVIMVQSSNEHNFRSHSNDSIGFKTSGSFISSLEVCLSSEMTASLCLSLSDAFEVSVIPVVSHALMTSSNFSVSIAMTSSKELGLSQHFDVVYSWALRVTPCQRFINVQRAMSLGCVLLGELIVINVRLLSISNRAVSH